jgi:ABC-type transport system involved in multi-copper enzyme maturation permease subunit
MIAIALLTLHRLREVAFIMLLLVGLGLSYAFAGMGSFASDILGREMLLGSGTTTGTTLLGTLLLVLLGGLIAIFNAAAEIPRDISTRLVAVLLSKPVSRQRYLWGKFLGTLLLVVIFTSTWLTTMLLCRHFIVADPTEPLTLGIALRQYWCLLFLAPVTAIATMVSCFFSDVISMIVSSVYIGLCFVAGIMPVIIALVGDLLLGKLLLLPYYCVPNLAYFFHGYTTLGQYLVLVVYALAICGLSLGLARLRFERGDVF